MKYRFVILLFLTMLIGFACSLGNSGVDEIAISTTDEPTTVQPEADEALSTTEPIGMATPSPLPIPTETPEAIATVLTKITDTLTLKKTDKIAYSFSNGEDFDIYLLNADGSSSIQLTDSPADELYPIWSPDGLKIAFISQQDARSVIYVMNTDGSNLTHLAQGGNPIWSPNSQQLAFVSEQNSKGEIYLINVDGSNLTRLTEGYSPAWSPDGQQIAFQTSDDANSKLYIINTDGSGLKHLIDTAGSPNWSPDGKQIAFTSYYDAPPPKVYLINTDGSNLTRLADGADPVWSPDGQRIAFRDISELADIRYETYSVINNDGTNLITVVTGIPQMRNIAPTWTPDGQRLVLISDRAGSNGTLGIDVINADGTDLSRLADQPGFYAFPAWSPKPIKLTSSTDSATSTGDTLTESSSASEGIILFLSSRDHDPDPQTAASPTGPAQNRIVELYVMKSDGSDQTRLTDGNRDWWNGNASITSYNIPNQVVINGKYVFDLTAGQIVEELILEFPNTTPDLPFLAQSPVWSLKGEVFFYGRKWNDGQSIYHLDHIRGEPQKLTSPPNDVWGDAWPTLSPDGEWLVFLRNWYDETQDGLWLMRIDGSQAHRIMAGSANVPRRAFWSPDGSKLVYEGPKSNADTFSFEVWVAEADGSASQQLTSFDAYTGVWEPRWSPDGKQIVFSAGNNNQEGQIFVIDADGGESQQLTTTGDANLSPLWLPLSFDDIHIPSVDE